jgi:hypothetical protein
MPASIPASAFLPVSSPANQSNPGKKIPLELQQFLWRERQNKANVYDKALAILTRATFVSDDERSAQESNALERMAQAINGLGVAVSETAQAAFSPQSYVDYATADVTINDDTWTDIPGLEREIVSPVPGRLNVILQLDALCVSPAAEALEIRVNVVATLGGTENVALGYTVMFSQGERHPVATVDLLDIQAQDLLTVKAQARIAVTGLSDYTILGDNGRSTMVCRVEARSLSTGS